MSSHISVHRIQRLLIVSPNAIGDRVLTCPAIAALRQRYPHLHITLLGSRDTDDLVHPTGLFDDILIDKCRTFEARGWRGFWRYVREIRAMRFDAVIHFDAETPEVWLTVFAGIRYQVGDKSKLGLWPIFRKYGTFLKTFDQTKHVVDCNFQLLRAFQMGLSPEIPLIPVLSSTPKTAGFHDLKNAGWEGQQPIATVATATTLQKQRHTLGIRDQLTAIADADLKDQILAQDSTSLHTLTGKSRMRLFWICQRMALTRFNLPLRIHGEHDMADPIASYSRHFESKKR